jgi:hypothetical protein
MSILSAHLQKSGGDSDKLVSCRTLYAAVIALLIANAVATKAGQQIAYLGLPGAMASGLGFSWVFWLCAALCVRLALTSDEAPAQPLDLWASGACVVAAMVPVSPISSLAATALGLFALWRGDERRRAAGMVLLAIAVQLLWSRLLMLVFAAPIANLDAHLVGLITQIPVRGNLVPFADGVRAMAIEEGCTSVQNASIALMLFVAIVRTFRPRPVGSEIFYLLGAFLSVVAINTTRLSLMAQSLAAFQALHGAMGFTVINLIITVNGLAWAALSVRREIFD